MAGDSAHANRLLEDSWLGGRKESTAGGAVLGTIVDKLRSNADEAEKAKRAEQYDFITHIAADTLAVIPRMRALTAGLVRGTMLLDTKEDLKGTVFGFAKNFTEGLLLNKVSRQAMPNSTMSQGLSRFMGGPGLKTEIATHLSVGGAFGFLRGAGGPEVWKDENGKWSLSRGVDKLTSIEGAKSIGTATAFGALINVPAGMAGLRIANRVAAKELGGVPAGVLSGAGSGSIFGGLDAIAHGRSLSEIFESTVWGGVIGAGTGGIFAASESARGRLSEANAARRLSSRVEEQLATSGGLKAHESHAGDADAGGLPRTGKVVELTDDAMSPVMQRLYEKVRFMPRKDRPTAELVEMVASKRQDNNTYHELDEKAPGNYGTFEKFAKWLRPKTEAVVVYKAKGHDDIDIVVPKDYDGELDAVRRLRIMAEKPAQKFDDMGANERMKISELLRKNDVEGVRAYLGSDTDALYPILKARIDLFAHKFGGRLLPEDVIPLLGELPDPRLVKRVLILDRRNAQDPWQAENFKLKTFRSAASANSQGEIAFYQTSRGDHVREVLFHEWMHLLRYRLSLPLYDNADALEKNDPHPSAHAKRNSDEDLAVLGGEVMLNHDGDLFLSYLKSSPIRYTVAADGVRRQMQMYKAQEPDGVRSPYWKKFESRLNLIETAGLKLTQAKLVNFLTKGTPAERKHAAILLGEYGNETHIPTLEAVASTTGSAELSRIAFQAMLRLHSKTPGPQLDMIVAHASDPANPLAKAAVESLPFNKDPRSLAYKRFFELKGNKDKLPEMMDLIGVMGDTRGRQMAFDEAVMMMGTPDTKAWVARQVLAKYPELAKPALDILTANPTPEAERLLRYYTRSTETEVSDAAKGALRALNTDTKLKQFKSWLVHGDDDAKVQAIDGLRWLGDNRAIEPLLQVVAVGRTGMSNHALEALGSYNLQMIRATARQLNYGFLRSGGAHHGPNPYGTSLSHKLDTMRHPSLLENAASPK